MFAYCGNNPVSREDTGGAFWNMVAGAVAGAAISAVTQAFDNCAQGKEWNEGLLLAAVGGAITGGLAATGAGIVVQSIVSATVSAGTDFISQATDVGVDNVNEGQIWISGIAGAVSGIIGGKGIQHKSGALSHAKGIYSYTLKKIQDRFWAADKASTYLDLAAKNLLKVWGKELLVTTARYTAGAGAAVATKNTLVAVCIN